VTAVIGFPDVVDEVNARLVAGGVVALGLLVALTDARFLLPVLFAGFVLRVLAGPRLSPLALLMTRVVRPRLAVHERFVPGPPKRFAQAVGAAFTGAATLLWLVGAGGAAEALVWVLVAFASLESFVGFCTGCWVFGHLMRLGVIPRDVCDRCAW
jgi:hypothetical protein